jgi:Rod binding domain-containing protein
MSIQGSSLPTASLPAVNQALEPTWVRNGSEATKKAYETALAFEGMLVEQLSKSMAATSGPGGESSSEGESGSEESGSSMGGDSELSSMLPQALSAGVMNAGGLGLAAQMTRQLQDQAVVPQAAPNSEAQGGAVGPTGGSDS